MPAARSNWVERAIARGRSTPEAARATDALIALALAPVKAAPMFPPIEVGDNTPVLQVVMSPVPVQAPERGDNGRVAHYGDADEAQAAMRAQLTDAPGWGERVRVHVLMADDAGTYPLVIEGRESAVRHAVPDGGLLASWAAAGATAFQVVTDDGRCSWFEFGAAPRVVQVERADRMAALECLPG